MLKFPILREEIKKLKTECTGAKDPNKNLQRMCAYMTRSATDATKRRGKGLTGVYELAEKSLRGCLMEHAMFVAEEVWPTVKRMPEHWTAFSTNKNSMSFRSVYNLRDCMPLGWTHEGLWIVFLVAVTVKQLKSIRSQRKSKLHEQYRCGS